MILDILAESERYTTIHAGFAEAFHFLRRDDLAALPAGRIEIDGSRVYALVMDVAGKGHEAAHLETHRKYVDIQYTVRGRDVIGWSSAAGLSGAGYDAAKDIEFFRDVPAFWVSVPAGHFAVFFPSDAHAPLAFDGAVRKVVVKVLAEP